MSPPPDLARRVIAAFAGDDLEREVLLGDLEEGFHHASIGARPRPRLWYWSQVLRSVPWMTLDAWQRLTWSGRSKDVGAGATAGLLLIGNVWVTNRVAYALRLEASLVTGCSASTILSLAATGVAAIGVGRVLRWRGSGTPAVRIAAALAAWTAIGVAWRAWGRAAAPQWYLGCLMAVTAAGVLAGVLMHDRAQGARRGTPRLP
jgi:hypothetical protein